MKSLRALTVASVMFVLAGCFAEDYSFCVTDIPGERFNVALEFRLPDTGGEDTFLDDISTVTTAVYHYDTKELVNTVTTSAEDHAVFKGVRMLLEPGTYRVVSWANAGTNTILNGLEMPLHADNAHVTYNTIAGGVTDNGDELYYAPNSVSMTRYGSTEGDYIMMVDTANGHEGSLDFRHAHRRIDVFVRGFDSGGNTAPIIRLTGLPSRLSFLGMKAFTTDLVSAEILSRMVSVNLPGGTQYDYALSPFNVLYLHTGDFDIGIDIVDPANGETVYTDSLNGYYTEDPAATGFDPDIAVQILIEFKGGTVEVSIPDWNSEDVGYGIWD